MVQSLEGIKQVKIEEALLANSVPGWIASDRAGEVQDLHSLENANWNLPVIWVMSPTNSSLVLGSSQDDACIDYEYAEKIDVGIARRRTGGGAVFVDPKTLFWVDLFVPRGHRLWNDDIGVASIWMGGVWKDALGSLGVDTHIHNRPFVKDSLAELVCFGGRAPGELLIGEKKVLGISQRRTRKGARFQCALALEWRPEEWIALFTDASTKGLKSAILASGTCVRLDRDEVLRGFIQALVRS